MFDSTQWLSFAYFGLAKFVGYTLMAVFLNHYFEDTLAARPYPPKAGLVRTLIGAVFGLPSAWLMIKLINHYMDVSDYGWLVVVGMIPVRVIEWKLFLRFMFDVTSRDEKHFRALFLGTFLSFFLDCVGILSALVLPGGIRVC